MRKVLVAAASAALVMSLAVPAMAKNPKHPADYNGMSKGKSDTHHLYLYEKDVNWDVVEDGAWGKLTYKYEEPVMDAEEVVEEGVWGDFVFNGHGLEPETEYTLVNYDDVWPTVVCMDSGTSTPEGNVHLSGDMPGYGQKVWLVPSDYVDCDWVENTGSLNTWAPAEYLFEYNVLY